jgi:glutathione S-transferase
MTQAGIEFEEVAVRFDSFEPGSAFKTRMAQVAPTGQVPVLVDEGWSVWDTLAIAEYLAERFPERALWPAQRRARARARSVCAELHAGFGALRRHLPMNIEAHMPEVGARVLAEHADVRDDVSRLCQLWGELLSQHGGPMLFADFSIADAFFAPVAARMSTYGVPLPPREADYVRRVLELPGVAAWRRGALAERDFLPFEEPYRSAPQAVAR